jgi:Zn ribbon nucleic-acid-binding protein
MGTITVNRRTSRDCPQCGTYGRIWDAEGMHICPTCNGHGGLDYHYEVEISEYYCDGCGSEFETDEELEAHLDRNPIYAATGTHMTLREYEVYYMGGDIDAGEDY